MSDSKLMAVNSSTPGIAYLFGDGTLGSTPTSSSDTAVLKACYFNVENDATTNSTNITDANDAIANTWPITLDSASNYWNTFIGKKFIAPTLLETFAIINSSSSTITMSGSSSVTLTGDETTTILPNGAWSLTFLFTSMTSNSSEVATSGVAKAFMRRIF